MELLLVLDTTFLGCKLSLTDCSEVFGGFDAVVFVEFAVLLLGLCALKLDHFPLVLGFGHHVAQFGPTPL